MLFEWHFIYIIMGTIKKIIRDFLPYGIVRLHQKKRTLKTNELDFWYNYKKYINAGEYVDFIKANPFRTVVSVQGFGYSGSGAVIDLLREYDTLQVLGYVDIEGTKTDVSNKFEEINILRVAGGLFEIEKYLGSDNIYQNDALLHRLINLFENSSLYQALPMSQNFFYEFIRRISKTFANSVFGQTYNRHINYKGINDVLILEDMSIKNFRNLCKEFLYSIFSLIHTDPNMSVLVLDQFVNDREFNMERYLEYVPNLKMITVYRDPRDIYAYAKKEVGGWIPHTSVEEFIQWYNVITKKFNMKTDKYHVVQFESLINDYDNVVSSIEQYIGLNSSLHKRMGTCLDVSCSRKNICLWKQNNKETDSDFIKIYNNFQQLCYMPDL